MARAAPVAVALCVGLALVWLAPPRVAAGLLALPARPVIAQLHSGQPVSLRDIAIADESQAAALAWIDDGRGWADLELIRQSATKMRGDSSAGIGPSLEQSIALHSRSLARSPAQAYAWTRLVRAELVRRGPAPRLGRMLELAITTAPYDRRLALGRLELCFLVWRQVDPRLHDLAKGQTRFAARLNLRRLAEMAKRRYATAIVRNALAEDADLRRRLDAALVKL